MSTLFNMAVSLSLNAGGFNTGMAAAGNALAQMATKAGHSQAAVDRLAASMKALAAGAVITGLGVAMALGLSDAAKKGADLQKVLTGIQLTTGTTTEQMAGLQRGLVGIALKNQMNVTDAANVALAAAHTGITDPKQLAQTVGTVANFAEVQSIANHTSRESATTTAVEYAHLFGAYIPSLLNPLVNTLSKALTHTPLSGKGFETLVSQFAGVTRSVYGTSTPNRLRLQSDDSLMGVLLGQLGQGSRGGTQYSSALSRMATAKKGTAAWAGEQALERAGHGQFFNKDGSFAGVQNMLQVLTTAAKTIGNPQELARINKAAFGMVGGRLMGLLEDPVTLQRWQQNTATFNRIPNLDKQQAAYNATNAGQSAQLAANVSTLVTLFGQALLPIMVKVTSAFVGLTKGAVEFSSAHPGLMKIVAAVAAITAGVALVVGPILMAVGAVGLLSVAFGAMDIALLPFTAIVVAVVAAIAGIVWAFTHWGNVVKFFQGVWGGLSKNFGPMLMMLSLVSPLIGPIVLAFKEWGNVTNWLGSVMSTLGKALKAVLTAMGLIHDAGKKPPTVYVPPSTIAASQHKPGGIQATAPLGGTTNTLGTTIAVPKILHPHAPSAPAHSGHGGGGNVTINHHNTFHINGSDHRSTEALANVVAKHIHDAQSRDLTHTARNSPLNHHGLNPRYS